MKKAILTLCLSALLSGCSSADDATSALASAGYKNIEIHGYAFFGCSEDDSFHTKFTATGPTGVRVNGVVCSGWMKGSTIRTD